METLLENILVYGIVIILCVIVVAIYLRKQARESREVEEKIKKAKEHGLHEPVSLHPVVDINRCIKLPVLRKISLGLKTEKRPPLMLRVASVMVLVFMPAPPKLFRFILVPKREVWIFRIPIKTSRPMCPVYTSPVNWAVWA